MSYALDVANEVVAKWRSLEIQLQELVWDELERVANNPPRDGGKHIYDVVHEAEGIRHYVFIEATVNHRSRIVVVTTVGYFARPIP